MRNAQYQFTVFVIAIGVVMVAATPPASADLGDQLFKLLADDGAAGDNFGRSVAISGSTSIVGAWLDADNGFQSGSAYLFDTTTCQQIAKLLPDDGAAEDFFGWSVALSGTTAIVGAIGSDDNGSFSGSAYLFDISDPANPLQIAKLFPDDGAAFDSFGFSVAISESTAIVGALADDDNGATSGSAYLFDTVTGRQLFKLLPDDGAAADNFGQSVAISGTTAIIGAYHDKDNGDNSGSAYLFDTVTGRQLFKLLPNDGAAGDNFGVSVAISGSTSIVAAWLDADNGRSSGSAYLFDAATGQQIAKLLPDDGAAEDRFGHSVAISGATAVVGARRDDDNGTDSGSAYLFDAGGPTGTPARLTSFTVLDGTLISGGLPRLRRSDDRHLEIEARVTGEVAQPHLMRMRIIAESAVQNPTEMVLTFESHITDIEGTVWLFMRNWRQGTMVQVAEFPVGITDDVPRVTIPRARRFIRASDGKIILRIKKIVFFPFTLGGFHSLIDHVEIGVR